MKAIFLASLSFLIFVGSANATEPAGYLTQYQAVGVVQYEGFWCGIAAFPDSHTK